MKTKTITLTVLLIAFCFSLKAQLNPVKNLSWLQHDNMSVPYNCLSVNCFAVSWSKPDISTDTLVGYELFRNDSLFAFTTDTVVACTGYAQCYYPGFFEFSSWPFWVKVLAIYNHDSIKSSADDSIHVHNIAIGIKENNVELLNVINNPIRVGENIYLRFTENENKKDIIRIISLQGQLMKQCAVEYSSNNIISVSTSSLSSGMFFITLISENKTLTRKLIIE